MFDGLPHDQLHSSSLPLVPLSSSFPLHRHVTSRSNTTTITASTGFFDPYTHHHLLLPLQQQLEFLHPTLPCKSVLGVADREKGVGLEIERDREFMANDPWTSDEVLALLRIRSTMENWFPGFTWEHVSTKLAELGFKSRSAENCREKFEEENVSFNEINNCTKSFWPCLGELEELYDHTQLQNTLQNHENNNTAGSDGNNSAVVGDEKIPRMEINPSELPGEDKRVFEDQVLESRKTNNGDIFGATREEEIGKLLEVTRPKELLGNKKRKISTRFEMFKGFCEEVVNEMMARQEEMHSKLLEDMVKRDEEKSREEEAWKRTEMDRMDRELEVMARETAIAGDRQATIIEFLSRFTSINGDRN